MKSRILYNVRRSTWVKKLFVYFGLFAMLFQYTYTAYASVLTSSMIYSDISKNPMYHLASSNSRYQYTAKPYFESSAVSAHDLKWFYNQLFSNYKQSLGEPTYVPVMVGDITTILPIYDRPRYVGSPLVQSRYIRFQIRHLLGRNLIDSEQTAYRSEAAQLNTLYSNALEYLDNENAEAIYGQNLNLDQTNSGLSQDIVWPEFRTINGERVVVPVVYLTAATYSERKITEHETQLNGTSQFNNLTIEGVQVKFGRQAFLEVAGDLNNGGSIAAQGDMQFAISGALNNVSGLIQAQGDLLIGAHSINNQTVVHRYDFGGNQSGRFGEVASINSVTGDVVLRSHTDILVQGGIVDAAGEITFAADGNIYVGPVQFTEHYSGSSSNWTHQQTSTEILQSRLSASQTIQLVAQGSIKIDASEIVSDQGHIELLAGLGITIEDELGSYQSATTSSFGDTDAQTSTYKTVAIRSVLDAGKGVRLHTDFGDITMKAVDVTSSDGTSVYAENGGVKLLLSKETDHYSYSSVTESLFTVESVSKGHNIENVVPNSIVGGFAVDALDGVYVEYEGVEGGSLQDQIENFRSIEGLSWMADLKDQVDADPDVHINWQEVETVFEEWSDKNTSLSPAAMAFVMVVVAICTAGAGTAAAGAVAAQGSATYAAVSAGVNAMISTAAAASISTAVNGGSFKDAIEAGYEAVLSDNGLENVAVAMVTAGAIAQIDAQFFNGVSAENVNSSWMYDAPDKLSLAGQTVQAVTHAAVQSGIQSVAFDADFKDSFVQSLAQHGINSIGREMAQNIGEAYRDGNIDGLIRYLAHAGVGCVIGGAQGDLDDNDFDAKANCVNGAVGAVVGEVTADVYLASKRDQVQEINAFIEGEEEYYSWLVNEKGYSEREAVSLMSEQAEFYAHKLTSIQARGVNLATLSGGFAALLGGGDVKIASSTGQNAAENNALFLIPLAIMALKAMDVALTAKEIWDVAKVYEENGPEAGDEALKQYLTDQGQGAIIGKIIPGGKSAEKLLGILVDNKIINPKLINGIKSWFDRENKKTSISNPDVDNEAGLNRGNVRFYDTPTSHERKVANELMEDGNDVIIRGADATGPDMILNGKYFDIKEMIGEQDNTLYNTIQSAKNNFKGTKLESAGLSDQVTPFDARAYIDARSSPMWNNIDLVRERLPEVMRSDHFVKVQEVVVLTENGLVRWVR